MKTLIILLSVNLAVLAAVLILVSQKHECPEPRYDVDDVVLMHRQARECETNLEECSDNIKMCTILLRQSLANQ
jgi:hypothetical protein